MGVEFSADVASGLAELARLQSEYACARSRAGELNRARHELAQELAARGVGSSVMARAIGVSQGTADRLIHAARRGRFVPPKS